MKRVVWVVLLGAATLAAQERTGVFTRRTAPPPDVLMGTPGMPMGGSVGFIAHEGVAPGQVVKGAPYAAEGVTETVQTLADGNRITRKNTAPVARDSEGRTRRENRLSLIGPFGVEGEPPALIMINDPVAKVHWLLNSKEKTAHKRPLPMGFGERGAPGGPNVRMMRHEVSNDTVSAAPLETFEIKLVETMREPVKPEETSLGTQVMEGVKVEGTRTVVRIEAGKIGNERPLEVVSERWYSPELQVVVMTKHSDPRFGETSYKLTGIDRREPPPALFQVPPDYKVVEGPTPKRVISVREE